MPSRSRPHRRFGSTKAVVVVQGGRIIAERYAAGVNVDTPLLGFSMTKSVVNALLGVLTQQGLVAPSMPGADSGMEGGQSDPRREIEVEHLMRMTSGLALDETNSGFDPSSQMSLHDDMAGFAVKAKMIAPPGSRWHYSSATTQLLARIVRDAVGGPEQTLAFAWRELFNPLGMRHVTLEFDGVGHAAGIDMDAGERQGLGAIRPALSQRRRGWRQAPPARGLGGLLHHRLARLGGDYAAGFWTNRSEHPNAKGRVRLGIPRDAFFASGDLGQRVVILPSHNLVIVRLGDSVDPTGDIRRLGRLVSEVIAATRPR